MPKFLHIIKTNGFLNDSRLIKWIDSLEEFGKASRVFILEDNNEKRTLFYKSTPIHATRLVVRKFFKKGSGYFFKVIEITARTLGFANKYKEDVLVFHDFQNIAALVLLCCFTKRKVIWDLHELPNPILLGFGLSRLIMRYLMQRVDLAVYTNEERRHYMIEKIGYTERDYFVLNNFNLRTYYLAPQQNIPSKIKNWQEEKRPYVIWLGIAAKSRNFDKFIEAFVPFFSIYDLVILGKIEASVQQVIDAKDLQRNIYSDYVPQNQIIEYIDNAAFSVILYKNNTPNNFYCEPNRLYQLVGRKKPVIVGNNPTMAKVVAQYKAGIILKDDGSCVEGLKDSISSLVRDYAIYEDNLKKVVLEIDFSWESQFEGLARKIKYLFG